MQTMDTPAAIPPLTARERRLIALQLGGKMTAADRALLFGGPGIDRRSQAELLMLACVGCEQGWELFPQKLVPRLKGLHHYYQAHNTVRMPWLVQKVRALRSAGIPVLLLKGLAMRYYYAPGRPRIMGDYDIAVPEERYEAAMRAVADARDTDLGRTCLHHGTVERDGRQLEVHCWIFKHHGEKGTDIWERALPCYFFGTDALVLCPEDMLLHLLDNRSRDLFAAVFPSRTPLFLCDCRRVLDAMDTISINRLAARAGEFHVRNSAARMLPLLADCFPELFSSAEIGRAFPDTPEYRRWLSANQRLQKVSERWRSYHYPSGGTLTPLRVIRALPQQLAAFRVQRLERGETGERYSLWRYGMEAHGAGDLRELLRYYATRLPGFGKRREKVV